MAKISKKMAKAINEQIIAELESSYIYLNIANYYVENGLAGFGAWFKKQAEEEVEHAEKFIDYLHSNGEKVVLTEIAAPKDKFKDDRAPLVKQVEHEEFVTSLIYKLMDLAIADKDYRTQEMLRWFISEQAEEEEHSHELLEKYDRYGKDLTALMHLDRELAQRK